MQAGRLSLCEDSHEPKGILNQGHWGQGLQSSAPTLGVDFVSCDLLHLFHSSRKIRKQQVTSRLVLPAAAPDSVEQQQVLVLRGGDRPECPGQEAESLTSLSVCHS